MSRPGTKTESPISVELTITIPRAMAPKATLPRVPNASQKETQNHIPPPIGNPGPLFTNTILPQRNLQNFSHQQMSSNHQHGTDVDIARAEKILPTTIWDVAPAEDMEEDQVEDNSGIGKKHPKKSTDGTRHHVTCLETF